MSTALVYGGPSILTVEQVVDPPVPAGSVVVTPVAVGICGSDVHGYEGTTGRRGIGQVMGHEIVGVLADAGDTGLAVGSPVAVNPLVSCGHCEACLAGDGNMCDDARVYGVDLELSGGLSDRLVVPAANVVPLASDDPACAVIEPLAVALQAVRSVGSVAGRTVVVVGAGMVGLGIAWAAVRDGAATVIVSDISSAKIANAARVGAVGVVTGETSLEDAVREVTTAPIDVVIDAVGVTATLGAALDLVRRGGIVCLVGMGSPTVSIGDYALTTKQVHLVGTWCYAPRVFAEVAVEVSSAPEKFSWLVDYEVALAEAPALFERLAHGYSPQLKVLVRPTL